MFLGGAAGISIHPSVKCVSEPVGVRREGAGWKNELSHHSCHAEIRSSSMYIYIYIYTRSRGHGRNSYSKVNKRAKEAMEIKRRNDGGKALAKAVAPLDS